MTQRVKSDLMLLLATILWGSAFAIMRVAAGHNTVFLMNGMRFLLGGLLICLLPAARVKGAFTRQNLPFVALAGLALFVAEEEENPLTCLLTFKSAATFSFPLTRLTFHPLADEHMLESQIPDPQKLILKGA